MKYGNLEYRFVGEYTKMKRILGFMKDSLFKKYKLIVQAKFNKKIG
jgi:hypothetical protein